MTEAERKLIERQRDQEPPSRFEPKVSTQTFLIAIPVAIVLGLYLKSPVLGGVGAVACALAALPFDFARRQRERRAARASSAAAWDPLLAIGTAETITARATAALRLNADLEGNAWFLQVSPSEILCVWDDAQHEPMEEVEISFVSGPDPYPLSSRWSGAKLSPLAPKRMFKRVERKPEQVEVLAGRLEELEELLRRDFMPPRSPAAQKTGAQAAAAEALAQAAAPLGFYKYLEHIDVSDARREIRAGIGEWFTAAERAFFCDLEALAEGGVADLLDYLRPVLEREGVEYGPTQQTYDAEEGYSITIGSQDLTLWAGDKEGQQAWDLTTIRMVEWINTQLAAASSPERLYRQERGACLLMLLTPELHELIINSGAFPRAEIPDPLPSDG